MPQASRGKVEADVRLLFFFFLEEIEVGETHSLSLEPLFPSTVSKFLPAFPKGLRV